MSDERIFIEKHYPHVLDMACTMIVAGLQITDRTGETSIAAMKFEQKPEGNFRFSYLTSHKTEELETFINERNKDYAQAKT